MRVVEGRRFGVHDRLVFFPRSEQVLALADEVTPRTLVRVRQTDAVVEHPTIFRSDRFRTSCVELGDDEALLAGMSRSSRQQLRRVDRLGDRVQVRRGPECAEEFRLLYRAFARAKGHARPLTRRRIAEYLRVSDVWIIRYDGEPYCARMLLRDEEEGRVRNLYEANRRFEGDADAAKLNAWLNRSLDWHAMRHYRDAGFSCFDWGGIGSHRLGPEEWFKISMGGDVREERTYVLGGSLARVAYDAFRRR